MEGRGCAVSSLGGLGNGRGHRLLASGGRSGRHVEKQPVDRLAVDRLAAALGLPSAGSPAASSPEAETSVPRTSVARPPRHRGVRARALDGTVAGVWAPVDPAPGVSMPVDSDTGRHRPTAEQLAGSVPQPKSAARLGRRAGTPESAVGGAVVGISVPVVPVPVVPVPVVLNAGRHRRPASTKSASPTGSGSRGVRANSRRLVVLGVLVLLMAVVAVFEVRAASARSSAQPQTVAAASHGQAGHPVAGILPVAFG